MGFFTNVISTIGSAVKAGGDFNPVLDEVKTKLEKLHAEGKLDDVVYEAEQAYMAEHKE